MPPPQKTMPQTKDAIEYAQIQDAICKLIDDRCEQAKANLEKLESYAENANNTLGKKDSEELSFCCKNHIQHLSAIIHVHHDVLDDSGKTRYLIKATEAMDTYCVCLHLIDVLSSNS